MQGEEFGFSKRDAGLTPQRQDDVCDLERARFATATFALSLRSGMTMLP
jgi:hypothetical protein